MHQQDKGYYNSPMNFSDLYHPLPAKHARLRGELYAKLNYQQVRAGEMPLI